MMLKNGDFIISSGELVNQSIGSWFKYQRQESQSFKESQWLHRESTQRYNALNASLTAKKEKLFRENPKNLAKWDLPASKVQEAIAVANDAEKACALMLPKETWKLNYLRDESAYFTNQMYSETRRTVMQDYTMAREHFVDMGEQMLRHIHEINSSWASMLNWYTDLNNARKEHDDTYVFA